MLAQLPSFFELDLDLMRAGGALAIREKALGPEHPDPATCLENYSAAWDFFVNLFKSINVQRVYDLTSCDEGRSAERPER